MQLDVAVARAVGARFGLWFAHDKRGFGACALAVVFVASLCACDRTSSGTVDAAATPKDSAIDAGDSDGGVQCVPLPASFETVATPPASPPFGNTVWFDPDIITASDPTSFVGVTYGGTGPRVMFDRRTGAFATYNAHLFAARFGAGVQVEVQVNPELSQTEAEEKAIEYATVIGRIPPFLFADLRTVWIHRGNHPFGGGNNNLLIHTEQGDDYVRDGVLEEVFVHEGTHTSIDGRYASDPNWRAAQQADGVAISPYAMEFPAREDLAETMGPYLAIRFRPERLDAGVVQTFAAALPNRLRYLDCLALSFALPP
ncbi:MAG: hypothetical protein ACKV2T_26670 [Kofleriaceae bacterium]